jgi:hypothetical protein
MGIALFHLLPESSESFTEYFEEEGTTSKWKNLPSSFFIAFISYSLILLLEKVAFDSHSITEHDHGDHHKIHHSHEDHSIVHKESDLIKPLLNKEHHKAHDSHEDHSHSNQQTSEIKESDLIKIDSSNKINITDNSRLIKKDSHDHANKFSSTQSHKADRTTRKPSMSKKKLLHNELSIKEKGYEEDDNDHNTSEVEEESEDDDELILKNVVSSKGKFASYLQARNIRKVNK